MANDSTLQRSTKRLLLLPVFQFLKQKVSKFTHRRQRHFVFSFLLLSIEMATANSIGLLCLYGAHGHMDRRRKCKLEDVPIYLSETK